MAIFGADEEICKVGILLDKTTYERALNEKRKYMKCPWQNICTRYDKGQYPACNGGHNIWSKSK